MKEKKSSKDQEEKWRLYFKELNNRLDPKIE